MVSLQVQLTEEQARRLEEIAVIRGVPQADLVRQAVETLLERNALERSPEELRQRALALAGRFHSGHHDTAERHDEVLADIYAEIDRR